MRRPRLGFVRRDRRRLDQRQPDVIEALEQTMLAERVQLKLDDAAIRAANFLVRQIDAQRRIRPTLRVVSRWPNLLTNTGVSLARPRLSTVRTLRQFSSAFAA